MCQQGVNRNVSITRHRADLRALARKANKELTPQVLDDIVQKKELIKQGIKMRDEHFANCDDCNGS